jgi:hypothetical protein
MSRFRRIPVADDGLEAARHALEVALDLAEPGGGDVEALVEGPLPPSTPQRPARWT